MSSGILPYDMFPCLLSHCQALTIIGSFVFFLQANHRATKNMSILSNSHQQKWISYVKENIKRENKCYKFFHLHFIHHKKCHPDPPPKVNLLSNFQTNLYHFAEPQVKRGAQKVHIKSPQKGTR